MIADLEIEGNQLKITESNEFGAELTLKNVYVYIILYMYTCQYIYTDTQKGSTRKMDVYCCSYDKNRLNAEIDLTCGEVYSEKF